VSINSNKKSQSNLGRGLSRIVPIRYTVPSHFPQKFAPSIGGSGLHRYMVLCATRPTTQNGTSSESSVLSKIHIRYTTGRTDRPTDRTETEPVPIAASLANTVTRLITRILAHTGISATCEPLDAFHRSAKLHIFHTPLVFLSRISDQQLTKIYDMACRAKKNYSSAALR